MKTLETFSTEDLFFILNCKKIKFLETKFGQTRANKLIVKTNPNKDKKTKILQSFFGAVNEAPSYPILTCWTLLDIASLGLISLGFITAALSGLMFVAAIIYSWSNYLTMKKESKKREQIELLNNLKLECADLLIARQKKEIHHKLRNQYTENELQWRPKRNNHQSQEIINKKDKNKIFKLKQSVGSTIVVSTAIFQGYYLVVLAAIAQFGLYSIASILTGPVGVCLALTVALGIGSYFGYRTYQSCKQVEQVKKNHKKIKKEIEDKRQTAYDLKDQLKKLNQPKCKKQHIDEKKSSSKNYRNNFHNNPMIWANRSHKTTKGHAAKQTYAPKLRPH